MDRHAQGRDRKIPAGPTGRPGASGPAIRWSQCPAWLGHSGLDYPRRGPKPEATDGAGAGVRVAGSGVLDLACLRAWFSATKVTTV